MTKDDLHALIEADRRARQDLLRTLVDADRRAQEHDLLVAGHAAPPSPGDAERQSLILLCRMVHDTLDQDDEEADELPGDACPEPLESLRRRLINLRRLLKAAQHDQVVITELQRDNARLLEERDEAWSIARQRLKDLQRIQASDDLDDRDWRDVPVDVMTTGQITAMRQELEVEIQRLSQEQEDRLLVGHL